MPHKSEDGKRLCLEIQEFNQEIIEALADFIIHFSYLTLTAVIDEIEIPLEHEIPRRRVVVSQNLTAQALGKKGSVHIDISSSYLQWKIANDQVEVITTKQTIHTPEVLERLSQAMIGLTTVIQGQVPTA